MAGETTKTVKLTAHQADTKSNSRLTRGREVCAMDYHAYTAAELEAADVLITAIEVPSNAIVTEIALYNDDLDSNATPTLATDIGLAAGQDFTSVTSGAKTKHTEDDVLDADLFVDGSTTLQAATTSFTVQAFDSVTAGPDDIYKAAWELLGYDKDPGVNFRLCITQAAAAATAAAGDVVIKCKFKVD